MCNLLFFDAIGTSTGIRFKGYNRLRSSLGGIFTLVMIVVTIVTVAFFGNLYLSGGEMSQVNNIVKYWDSQNITITNNFQIAVQTRYAGLVSTRQDLWRVVAYYVNYSIESNTIVNTALNKTDCSKEYWGMAGSQYDLLSISEAFCFDIEGLQLSGNSNTKYFKYINIQYSMNLDETNATNVTAVSNLIAQLQPVSTFFFLEGIFSINGKEYTPSFFINSLSIPVSFGTIKEIDVSVSQDQLQMTEDRLILSDQILYTDFTIQGSQRKNSDRTTGQKNLITWAVMPSIYQNVAIISFLTFSEMLARVGGIVQNLITIFFLINYLKSFLNFEHEHFSEMFERIGEDYKLNQKLMVKSFKHNMNNNFKEKKERDIDDILNINNAIGKDRDHIDNNYYTKKKINDNSPSAHKYIQNQFNEVSKFSNGTNLKNTSINPSSMKNLNQTSVNNINSENNSVCISQDNVKSDNTRNNLLKNSIKFEGDGMVSEVYRNEDLLNQNKFDKPIKKSISDSQKSYINPLKITKNNLDSDIFKNLNSEGKITINFSSYFCNKYFYNCTSSPDTCFKNSNKQHRLFDSIENYLTLALEVRNFEKMFFQLNMMKYLFLSGSQLEIFEKTPLLTGIDVINKIDSISKENDYGLLSNFTQLKEDCEDKTPVDFKLYGLFKEFH